MCQFETIPWCSLSMRHFKRRLERHRCSRRKWQSFYFLQKYLVSKMSIFVYSADFWVLMKSTTIQTMTSLSTSTWTRPFLLTASIPIFTHATASTLIPYMFMLDELLGMFDFTSMKRFYRQELMKSHIVWSKFWQILIKSH